jgi:hypothetical protein
MDFRGFPSQLRTAGRLVDDSWAGGRRKVNVLGFDYTDLIISRQMSRMRVAKAGKEDDIETESRMSQRRIKMGIGEVGNTKCPCRVTRTRISALF